MKVSRGKVDDRFRKQTCYTGTKKLKDKKLENPARGKGRLWPFI